MEKLLLLSLWPLCASLSLQIRSGQLAPRAHAPPGRKPVMWVHIHKAAGTSMCQLAGQMQEKIVQPMDNCNYWGDWVDGVKALATKAMGKRNWTTCEERRSLFTKMGFTWGAIERELSEGDICPNDFIYGAVLREPIERLESEVNFDHISNYRSQIECIKRRQCDEQETFVLVDNYVVRSLLGYDAMWLPPGGVNASHLARAIQRLESFDLVLPMDKLSSPWAAAELGRVLGWQLAATKQANEDAHTVTFTEGDKKDLYEINRYDVELYRHFLAKFA